MGHSVRSLITLLFFLLVGKCWSFAPIVTRSNSKARTHRYTATADSPTSDAAADKPDVLYVPKQERTYYQILGASPTATRAELKTQYVAMARLTHPDALIGTNSTGNTDGSTPDFSDIANAWKILSDEKERRRYDRSLKAEHFKKNVENAAAGFSKTAGPQVRKVIDEFAVPFLRRTTVTTVATVSAAVGRLTTNGSDFGSAFSSAVKAGVSANRVVDGIELREKSEELYERAAQEAKMAEQIKGKLDAVKEQRKKILLTTPKAGISSSEAFTLLEGLNCDDSPSMVDRFIMMRRAIQDDINELEETETEYYDKIAERSDIVQTFRDTQVCLKRAAQEAKDALNKEIEARKALEEAQQKVADTKQQMNDLAKAFAIVEKQENKVTAEVKAIAEALSKRQEVVRKALRRKEHEIEMERLQKAGKSVAGVKPPQDKDDPTMLEELERLQKEEQRLVLEHSSREESVARLLSRASKLKHLADDMDDIRNPAEPIQDKANATDTKDLEKDDFISIITETRPNNVDVESPSKSQGPKNGFDTPQSKTKKNT